MSEDVLPSAVQQINIQSDEGAALLDVVDQLRDLGSITHELSLPQIVVVGDQSSGKSSVLEAISGLSFPTNEGLCTQFATEVILRRSRTEQTKASIRTAVESRKDAVEGFSKKWRNFKVTQLHDIVEDAKIMMGLSDTNRFSGDVLRLEICGPKQDHLTLVDLPGLFANLEGDQSPTDRDMVRKIINENVSKQRTIVLTIIAASSDYQTQGILDLVRAIDKTGERTLGVVTMPDLLTEGTPRFTAFKALIDNHKWSLRLGWHVLRCPNFLERQQLNFDRKTIEDSFFESHAWSNVPALNRGASRLRSRLARLLKDHISKELPVIMDEVRYAIERLENERIRLGEEMDTPERQRAYLTRISERFKYLVTSALQGEYNDAYFGPEHRRLRAVIMNANDLFAKTMVRFGHQWQQEDDPQKRPHLFSTRSIPPHPFTAILEPHRQGWQQILGAAIATQRSHRALELPGLPQPRLVGILFKQQSLKWEKIAITHLAHVIDLVKDFVEDLLNHVASAKASAVLLTEIFDPSFEAREAAVNAKMIELLRPYQSERPMTFSRNFKSLSTEDVQVNEALSKDFLNQNSNTEIRSCTSVIRSMQQFYDIALDVVLDNISLLAVENCLLQGLDNVLSPTSILKYDEPRLERMAGDSPDVISRRRVVIGMLEQYRRAQKRIKSHIQRPNRSKVAHIQSERIAVSPQPHQAADTSTSVFDLKVASKPFGPGFESTGTAPRASTGLFGTLNVDSTKVVPSAANTLQDQSDRANNSDPSQGASGVTNAGLLKSYNNPFGTVLPSHDTNALNAGLFNSSSGSGTIPGNAPLFTRVNNAYPFKGSTGGLFGSSSGFGTTLGNATPLAQSTDAGPFPSTFPSDGNNNAGRPQ